MTDILPKDLQGLKPSTSIRDKLMQINIPYTRAKQDKLKKFCGLIGLSVAKFTSEALDNEIEARLDAMSDKDKKAVRTLLGIKT